MQKNENTSFFGEITKGVFTSIIVTLASVLIFAFIIKFARLESGVVKSVNQFIKVLSVFLGCSFCVRGGMGFIKGCFIGAISTALFFVIFSFFGAQVSFGFGFALELIFGALCGAISGIISVNVKRHA